MRPYFERDGIVLYHGDAREILPALGKGWADLVIADVPYGVAYESNRRTASETLGPIVGDESEDMARQILKATWPCLAFRRHAYVFGSIAFDERTASKPVELVWDKGLMSGGDLSLPWGKAHEPIQFQVSVRPAEKGSLGAPARMRRGTVLRHQRPNGAAIGKHPTEKPVPLLRELIESSSRIGEMILDPCCGSGRTGVAAYLEGRKAVLIEIEERHCETAARDLADIQCPTQFQHEGLLAFIDGARQGR